MKNKIIPAVGFALVSGFATQANAMDAGAAELHIKRLDDIISRVRSQNDEILKNMRALERHADEVEKENKELHKKLDEVVDEILKVRNTDIANLKANQQAIYDDYKNLNWGTEKRDCPGIGKHQQIKNTQSADGNYTLRYLCYDGRTLHLGTEVHQPPVE